MNRVRGLNVADGEATNLFKVLPTYSLPTDPAIAALFDAWRDASSGNQIQRRFDRDDGSDDGLPGGPGAYPTVGDLATFEFEAASGAVVSLAVPCPANVFDIGGETVDPLLPDSAALIAAALLVGCDQNGNALVEYRRGWRQRRG
jgi:hypothetical protein